MTLLIVNDEILTADTMQTSIDWENYGIDRALVAYNTERAKQVIKACAPDLMLCDIEMPGENGIALLKWTRTYYPDIECIYLTCHASFTYAQEALSLGCQDYLLMPAKYEEVGATVQKVVKRILNRRQQKEWQDLGERLYRDKLEEAKEAGLEKMSSEEIVGKAEQYILQHLGEESLRVEEVANVLHFHPVYLNRLFKKHRGISVRDYIHQERMKLAAWMLESGKMSINAIAEEVGYQSYSGFNMMFRKYFGCTPGQYLAAHGIREESMEGDGPS